ncbi:MAG: protein kinase domain-containing protein [Isosphaeraceae bacterium]
MNAPSSDRNLLLGILALQMDFITRDALVEAMHVWTLEKSRLLSDILVERCELDPTDRVALEGLVDRHIARHGGDAKRSLSSIEPAAPVRAALEPLERDPELSESLSQLGMASTATDRGSDPGRTASYRTIEEETGGRYRILGLHEEGGLGSVFRAIDKEVHREVALKQLKEKNSSDPQSRARFVLEAEITGNLEHPGVVPVYGKGRYEDGRPYYAMRFVRGETFKAAIDRFHKDLASRTDPGGHHREFQKLVRRFLVVCETMAYAHSRGVIHRDLKPRNILLGPYGETLIADWGLAKVVGRSESVGTDEATLRPCSSDGLQPTMAGSHFGTPEYMSPEQARGDIDHLGPATDVYSLGATLYYLLTGKHAFRGDNALEVLAKVKEGGFRPPREAKPGVPRALDAICLKAMALEPEDRYTSCRTLADDLEHWLADQPVSAYPEPLATRAMRGIRHHRHLVASVAAILILALVGILFHDRRLAQENARVVQANEQSHKQLEMTRKALREQFRLVADQLPRLPESESLRESHTKKMLGLFQELLISYPDDPDIRFEMAEVYRILALVRRGTGQLEGALDCHRAATSHYLRLVDNPKKRFPALRGLVQTLTDCGELYRMSGRTGMAVAEYQRALGYCDRLADDPDSSHYRNRKVELLINQSELLLVQGRGEEALAGTDQAVKLLETPPPVGAKVVAFERGTWLLAMALTDRGLSFRQIGDPARAEADFRRALAVIDTIHADSNYYRDAQCQRTVALDRFGDFLLANERRGNEAGSRFAEAVGILRRLVKDHPGYPYYREELAVALTGKAQSDLAQGRGAEADRECGEAMTILDGLRASEPSNPQYFSLLAQARLVGRSLSLSRGGEGEARQELELAVSSLTRALELDPDRRLDGELLTRLKHDGEHAPAK